MNSKSDRPPRGPLEGDALLRSSSPGKGQSYVKTIGRLACAIAATGTWLWISGCTMTLPRATPMAVESLSTTSERENPRSIGSIALLSPNNNVDQIEANYRAQCGAQAEMENHEAESCQAVPLITLIF